MTAFPLEPFEALVEINPRVSLARDAEHDFVAMEDVTAGQRYVKASRKRPLAGGAKFLPGDTLLARITPCLENGKVAQYDPQGQPGLGSTEFIVIRAKSRRTDPGFAFYLAASNWVRDPAIGSMSGASGRQRADANVVRRAEVPAPSLDEQRRIASILSAYDDLIEVNRRRVAVLEAMARGLFEEWFVRFRFPGHENHKIIETPDGPLPEGWQFGKIAHIVKLRSGFAFKSSTFVDGGQFGLVTIKHVHNGDLIPPFDSRLAEIPPQMPAFCRIMNGDILLSLTGNVGRTCLAWGEDLLLNQRVAKIEPVARNSRAFAYAFFRLPLTRAALENISNGAAQQNLSPVRAMEMPIKIPSEDLFSRFELVVGPMLDAVVGIKKSTAVLTAQRDLLLPRLISGELSVAAAEAELEAAA